MNIRAMYYTYILLSKKDNKFYIGYSTNLRERIKRHKAGKVNATKNRLPVTLIFYEVYLCKSDAKRREKYFKTTKGKKALRLILRNSIGM